MKSTLLVPVFLLFSLFGYSQTPCENGFAGSYPCDGYDLLAHFNLNVLNASSGNDSWGWTDPEDGKEYAIVCLDNGTAFFDISDPVNTVYLGKLPTQTGNSIWRDAKVYNNYVFVVSDANPGHGMQVFDLTRLRNVNNPPVTFSNDAHYDQFGSAHNIAINEETGYAYVIGSPTFNGGPHIINIQNPLNPTFAGGYSDHDYTHDAQIVNYFGPDTDYQGREIFVGSNAYQVVILDVTEKNNIQFISSLDYNNVEYTHQGWFTEDQRYFILGDELDEVEFGFNTRTLVLDLTDLDNPTIKHQFNGATGAIDHNGYVVGDKFYLANYTAGVRVYDISDIDNNNINEVGYFDTYPQNNNTSFNGVWNVYPFFKSGCLVIGDMDRGFFLIRDSNHVSIEEHEIQPFTIFPNPAVDYLVIKAESENLESVEIYNTVGQLIDSVEKLNLRGITLDVSNYSKGIYLMVINGNTVKKFIKK
ncbi:MAG TPA: choice-of-anchor B family protein [Flavobacteriaceae bacterium]|nr:choice-of-anchor B family protein [Flavobacteriaceae bacterium]